MALTPLKLKPKTTTIEQEPGVGVSRKPDACKRCPYSQVGAGWCPDLVNSNPKLAFWLEAPGENEILNCEPLTGRTGEIFNEKIIFPLGIKREEIIIMNTIRCRPPQNDYPTGWLERQAEEMCRMHDDAIKSFNPELFVVTLHPSSYFQVAAHLKFIKADVEKAYRFAQMGIRVCVLMGGRALKVAAQKSLPISVWRGHWFYGKYPLY